MSTQPALWMTQSRYMNSGQPDGYVMADCDRCSGTGENDTGSKCRKCGGHRRIYRLDEATLDQMIGGDRGERHIFETEGRQDGRLVDTPCAVCGEPRQAGVHRA